MLNRMSKGIFFIVNEIFQKFEDWTWILVIELKR